MNKRLIPTNMSRISEPLIRTHLSKWQLMEPQYPFIDDNNKLFNNYLYQKNTDLNHYKPILYIVNLNIINH